ncbi:hypothetical protein CWATWH0402_2492 [Crocosphaera watsonii WH 0402]|uniref:Uncharacterized protein n=1 Tax=Crocosphaera watsonii WH 0402 TaxID=1284629 RepID=T2JVV4_CROWT|nr:hypothetical protein CWATWH0402_2492 [Crocosphaera watsonii WH 0402]
MNQSAFFNGEYPLTRKLFVIVKKMAKVKKKPEELIVNFC